MQQDIATQPTHLQQQQHHNMAKSHLRKKNKKQSRIAIKISTKCSAINVITPRVQDGGRANILDWNPTGLLEQIPPADK